MRLSRISKTPQPSGTFGGLALGDRARPLLLVSILVGLPTCGSKREPGSDRVGSGRDAGAECEQILELARSKVAPLLAKLGIKDAKPDNKAGLTACARYPDATRTCLLTSTADWAKCKVEPPFTLYEGVAAHDALLGAKLPPVVSDQRVAELAGTWHHPAVGLDDAITFKIGPGAKLAIRRTSKKQGKRDDPPKEIAFPRERLLAIKTGTSSQFVPVFLDGKHLYLSWTSGALAIPVPNKDAFVLDLADRDRWVIWMAPSCKLLDPKLGASDITCRFEDDAFVVNEQRWPLRNGVLIHPAMEVFTRQGK